MLEIDHSRHVYVQLAFVDDCKEQVIAKLADYDFKKELFAFENAARRADIGDYAVYPMIENDVVWLLITLVTARPLQGNITSSIKDKVKL